MGASHYRQSLKATETDSSDDGLHIHAASLSLFFGTSRRSMRSMRSMRWSFIFRNRGPLQKVLQYVGRIGKRASGLNVWANAYAAIRPRNLAFCHMAAPWRKQPSAAPGGSCGLACVAYLLQGPPITTTHRTHRTHRKHRTHHPCISAHTYGQLRLSLCTALLDEDHRLWFLMKKSCVCWWACPDLVSKA
jgi:hypothetical protein